MVESTFSGLGFSVEAGGEARPPSSWSDSWSESEPVVPTTPAGRPAATGAPPSWAVSEPMPPASKAGGGAAGGKWSLPVGMIPPIAVVRVADSTLCVIGFELLRDTWTPMPHRHPPSACRSA